MAHKAKGLNIELRAVFYKDGRRWFAHCLEMDVVGNGSTKPAAFEMMCEAVNLQIATSLKHDCPANIFMPADARFFEMFFSGRNIAFGKLEITSRFAPERFDGVVIDDLVAREFRGQIAAA